MEVVIRSKGRWVDPLHIGSSIGSSIIISIEQIGSCVLKWVGKKIFLPNVSFVLVYMSFVSKMNERGRKQPRETT